MDVVRMIAYRAETRMMAPVITAQGKKPNARILLRALLTCDANIIPDPAQGILRVQLLGLGSDACDRMLAPLVAELNATRTIYPRHRTQACLRNRPAIRCQTCHLILLEVRKSESKRLPPPALRQRTSAPPLRAVSV